jgi:hypothetical protein
MTRTLQYVMVCCFALLNACASLLPNSLRMEAQEESKYGAYDRFRQVHTWSMIPLDVIGGGNVCSMCSVRCV